MEPLISSITSLVTYEGALRTKAVHLRSGETLISDAPIDNNGQGAAFSPTDLVATALASCMLTIMGIVAEKRKFDLPEMTAQVEKVMASDPRRISRVHIRFSVKENSLDAREKKLLEKAARACPVAKSLHPDIDQVVEFDYQ